MNLLICLAVLEFLTNPQWMRWCLTAILNTHHKTCAEAQLLFSRDSHMITQTEANYKGCNKTAFMCALQINCNVQPAYLCLCSFKKKKKKKLQ